MTSNELIAVQAEILRNLNSIIDTDNADRLKNYSKFIKQRMPVYLEAFEQIKHDADMLERVKSAILR